MGDDDDVISRRVLRSGCAVVFVDCWTRVFRRSAGWRRIAVKVPDARPARKWNAAVFHNSISFHCSPSKKGELMAGHFRVVIHLFDFLEVVLGACLRSALDIAIYFEGNYQEWCSLHGVCSCGGGSSGGWWACEVSRCFGVVPKGRKNEVRSCKRRIWPKLHKHRFDLTLCLVTT
jgi:hypothetical protein